MKSLQLLPILFLLLSTQIFGQSKLDKIIEGSYIRIKLIKATEIRGILMSKTDSMLVIDSDIFGSMDVKTAEIISIKVVKKSVLHISDNQWFDNPMSNKNFITETAIGLKKGQSLYQNVLLGGHAFSYGISDNFNLGGGIETFSLFQGDSPVLFISPKFVFPNKGKNLHFGLGANLLAQPSGSDKIFAGSVYGLMTVGDYNNNFTLGVGYAFFDYESTELPVIQIGGMTRIGRRFMLVSDHLLVSDNYESVLVGTWTIRYITERLSIDLGAAISYEGGAIPVFGASFVF